MTDRHMAFLVPRDHIERSELLDLIHGQLLPAVRELPRKPLFVVTNDDSRAQSTGWWLFRVLTAEWKPRRPCKRSILSEPFVLERKLDLSIALADPESDVWYFERLSGDERVFLLSNGPFYGGTTDAFVGVEFPQRGFSNARLRELCLKEETELDDDQWRAVSEYRSALEVGLDRFHGAIGVDDVLSLSGAGEWFRFDAEANTFDPIEAPPEEWGDLLMTAPESSQWFESGLKQRRS